MRKDNLTYSFISLKQKLHQSAMKFLKDDEDAKDVLQDTFLKLWMSNNIESDAEAKNKLFTVLRNLCIDKLRKHKTIPLTEMDEGAKMIEITIPEDLDRFENLLLCGVSDTQYKIYSFVVHEGMEYDEIASLLNMTVEAVRMNMSRARKKIHANYKRLNR